MMRAVTHTAVLPRRTTQFVWGIGLSLFIVLWSFGFALGCSSATAGEPLEDETTSDDAQVVEFKPDDEGNETESVTMSISLEEGGVIDLDAPVTDVKIERWQGDEVLVIVEKTKRPQKSVKSTKTADAVNIQVTRYGKNVRIQTTGGDGLDQSGMDLSFRIVLPDRYHTEPGNALPGDTMTRLTSTLWRAVHKEALKWLVR
jgi:hypothetical protein